MSNPVLHLMAGPNGAGKSTFVERLLQPVTKLPFVNADLIAAERWPEAQAEHAYEAARLAEAQRRQMLEAGESFISATVFSHPSKVGLIERAQAAGFLVHLYVVLVPVDLTVQRVSERVRRGGHAVPEHKIRERHERLWGLIAQARRVADQAKFYDNSSARRPYRKVATYLDGRLKDPARWPQWAPEILRSAERS